MITAEALRNRRSVLAHRFPNRALCFFSGAPAERNIPTNEYNFRASSHFLFYFGSGLPLAFGLIENGTSLLFVQPRSEFDQVWEGGDVDRDKLKSETGVDDVLTWNDLPQHLPSAPQCLIAPHLLRDATFVERQTGRSFQPESEDKEVVDVLIEQRLIQDEAGVRELREAIQSGVEAQRLCRSIAHEGITCREVLAEFEKYCTLHDLKPSFQPIITTRGDVLHRHDYSDTLRTGDLLLCDCGVERPSGYCSDLTRTWPIGDVTSQQQEILQLVARAQKAAIAAIRPGTEWRAVHHAASLVLAEGLHSLGLLRCSAEDCVERGAHALFFPHGIGHLLGLDVHDLEDLGDRAGYEKGRERSKQFGLNFLRLDRPLKAGMVVTVEPGLYFSDFLLFRSSVAKPYSDVLNKDEIKNYLPLRGVRIEDNVLVTAEGCEVLSSDVF